MLIWLKLVPELISGEPDMDSWSGRLWEAQELFISLKNRGLLDDLDRREELLTKAVLTPMIGALFGILPQQDYYAAGDWLDSVGVEHRLRDTDYIPEIVKYSEQIRNICQRAPVEYRRHFGSRTDDEPVTWEAMCRAMKFPDEAIYGRLDLKTMFILDRALNPEPFKRVTGYWKDLSLEYEQNGKPPQSQPKILLVNKPMPTRLELGTLWVVTSSAEWGAEAGDVLAVEEVRIEETLDESRTAVTFLNLRDQTLVKTRNLAGWAVQLRQTTSPDPRAQDNWRRAVQERGAAKQRRIKEFRQEEETDDFPTIRTQTQGNSEQEQRYRRRKKPANMDNRTFDILTELERQVGITEQGQLEDMARVVQLLERMQQELPGLTDREVDTMVATIKKNRSTPEYPVQAENQDQETLKPSKTKSEPKFRILEPGFVVDPDPED